MPLRKQFEQILNAFYLQRLGYGEHHGELSPAAVRTFYERADRYAEALTNHRQQRNDEILAALDDLLADLQRSS